MKAYSYIRFSTDRQTWGDSERRQEQQAKEFCNRKGLKLAEAFADRGISGWKGKNRQTGAFSELMKVTKPGDFILIEDNDRFSREDPITALVGLRDIVQRGVTIAFLKTGVEVNRQNFNDATVLFPNFFQAYLGNQENEKKSFRVSEAWKAKRDRIKDGEKMTQRCVAWLKLSEDRKSFKIIPERAEIVRQIFELSRSGLGANNIAKRFNRAGIKPFGRAAIWFSSYIKKILESRAVIGEFSPGTMKGGNGRKLFEAIPNYYPAVVSKELFATVYQMRKARPSYTGKSGFNVFSKLAFDREGNPMSYVNKNRAKGWHYLVSATAVNGVGEYRSWQYDDFLADFLAVCQNAALHKAPEIDKGIGEIAAKRLELAEIEKQIERLVDFILKGASSAAEAKLRAVEAQKAEIHKRITELESQSVSNPVDVSKIDWKDAGALRDNLRSTVKRITVDVKSKCFEARFFDGRVYECRELPGGQREITMPASETAP